MIEKLRSAFSAYANRVDDRLFPRQTESKVKPIRNRQQLLTLVEGLEGFAEFRNLVTTTREHFGQEHHSKSEQIWRYAIENFFRRSACYLDLFEGRTVIPDNLFGRFVEAFTRTETTVLYLAPLEFVDFRGSDMEYHGFQNIPSLVESVLLPFVPIKTVLPVEQYQFLEPSEPYPV